MNGKSAYIFILNRRIIFVGYAKDQEFCSSKEAEAKVILYDEHCERKRIP